LPSTEKT